MQPPEYASPAPQRREDAEPRFERLLMEVAPVKAGTLPTRANARYEDFLRSAIDWLWETDNRLNLTYASSPITLRLGIPSQVLVGRSFLSLGKFESSERPEQQAEAAIASRRPFRNAVYVIKGKDGEETAFKVSGVPYFDDAENRFAGYRGTATAIPAGLKEQESADTVGPALMSALEETLERYQDIAWRLAQLESERSGNSDSDATKNLALARTAHELRTPLNAIVGYSDLALNEMFGPLSERYADCFRTIREAGRHLDQLVSHIHEDAKPAEKPALAADVIEIAAIVAKAKAITALTASNADVDISRVGPLAGGRVKADRLACTQIIVNLLSNAIKFTQPGGAVGMETLVGSKNMLEIVVWDTGVGIPEEEQAKIFDATYRANRNGQTDAVPGHGLGLAIARDLARAMGGDITVSSSLGSGSRFTLSLPLAAESTPANG